MVTLRRWCPACRQDPGRGEIFFSSCPYPFYKKAERREFEQVGSGSGVSDLVRALVALDGEGFVRAFQRMGEQGGLPVVELFVAQVHISQVRADLILFAFFLQ